MTPFSTNYHISSHDHEAWKLAKEVQNYTQIAQKQKRDFILYSEEEAPIWCNHLINKHLKLKSLANSILQKDKTCFLPSFVVETLDKSQNVINELALRIQDLNLVKRIYEACPQDFSDPTKLLILSSKNAIPSHASVREWEMNFALLRSAYSNTDNDHIKKLIRFLMINYLAKSAFLNALPRGDFKWEEMEAYRDLVQLGQLSAGFGQQYYRNIQQNEPGALGTILDLDQQVAAKMLSARRSEIFCIECPDIDLLYLISFKVMPAISEEELCHSALSAEFAKNKDNYSSENILPYDFPCLIDVTRELEPFLITKNDKTKEHVFQQEYDKIRQKILSIVYMSAENISQQHPEYHNQKEQIARFLALNLVVVAKATFSESLSVFIHFKKISSSLYADRPIASSELSSQEAIHRHIDLTIRSWIATSCVSPSAVSYRKILAECLHDPSAMITESTAGQEVSWAPVGSKNTTYFSSTEELINSNLFQKLWIFSHNKEELMQGQKLLASITLLMIKSLHEKIPKQSWTAVQEEKTLKEIIQFSLYRLKEHLANAFHNRENFRLFSQSIDCAHSDLTAILTIFQPLDAWGEFTKNYSAYLRQFLNLPKGVCLHVGLAKSAMNIFSGINAITLKNKPNAIRGISAHSYYEEVDLLGKSVSLQEIAEKNQGEKFDLYFTEFYHNIDIDIGFTHYDKNSVVNEIKSVFDHQKFSDRFTVAIDATIDLLQSNNIKELIDTFSEEILVGKLNIIIFRSGQKFDMFGLDHYFGAPYYIINNGEEKWQHYHQSLREPLFQTDPLSQQYFALLSPDLLEKIDEYKQLIFNNTRKILDAVPIDLHEGEGKDVFVCSFSKETKTPFIDIRFGPEDQQKGHPLLCKAHVLFMRIFLDENKITYNRGSFGFAHPNITIIEPKLRINPGIDPAEIPLYLKFFDELAALIKES